MPETLRLDVALDDATKTLRFKVVGYIESRVLTDLIIEAYEDHKARWSYRRIFDYRRANGLYDFAEVERLLAWWREASRGISICHFVAILSEDPLFDFRARVFDDRYSEGEIRMFKDLRTAINWLDEVAPLGI